MKKNLFIVVFISIISINFCFAQDLQVPNLELVNQIYLFNASDSKITKLEKAIANVVGKTTTFKSKLLLKVKGTTSTVHNPQSETISFLVELGNSNLTSPAQWFTMFKADKKKDSREVVIQSMEAFKGNTTKDNIIIYDVKRIRGSVYQLIISSTLEKGEYIFKPLVASSDQLIQRSQTDVYCITID